MPITRVTSPGAPEPEEGLWSNCLVSNGIVYVSGMTARGGDMAGLETADSYTQSKIIFGKIKSLVEAAGGSMADVVKLTIFVTDIRERDGVWKARREFFTGNFPTSTLVGTSALADPRLKVEIEAVAHLGASKG